MRQSDILQPDLKEPVFHGDVLSPYTYYHCAIPQTFQDLLAHWHEEAEIAIIREGKSSYHIASVTYEVQQGDLVFLTPNTLHSITEIPGCSMISDTLVFHLNLLGCSTPDQCSLKYFIPLQKNIYYLTPLIHPTDPGYPQICESMEQIMDCITDSDRPCFEMLLKELLFHLFLLLYQYHYVITDKDVSTPEIGNEKMKQALTYIEQNYKDSIRISTLAALCNFSEVHFMTLFKKNVGTSCIEYINLYRLGLAAGLLLSSDDPVLSIALDCGFTNISYFNRQFKNKFHMTPLEYRKRRY